MKHVIAIPTHISGVIFLENLLRSIDKYNKYDIIVVINEFKRDDEEKFDNVINKSTI